MIEAREYQERLLLDVHFALREGVRRILLVSPTGSGKTVTMTQLCQLFNNAGLACTFMAPRRELIKQISKKLTEQGIRHGVILAGHPGQSLYATNQVASIDTLLARAVRRDRLVLPHADVVFVDEAHLSVTVARQTLFRMYPQAVLIGVTATPSRKDGRPLKLLYDRMIQATSVRDLIEQGYLSQYRLFAPATVDVSGLHTRMGDYVTSEAAELVNKPRITGDAISHYRRHCDGARAIVFAVSIEHSKAIAAAFNAEGIPALHIDGNTDGGLRDAMMQDFRDGRVRVLTNVDLFGEGMDVPAIEAAILLRPTQSLAMYLQQVGRALRPSPGKQQATILDHVSNSSLHGLPDEPRTWELTATVRRDRPKLTIPSPRICASCFGASRSGSRVCVVCGEPFAVEPREIKQVEGELADVTDIKRARRQANPAKDLAGLIELGRKRGYASPERWANHVWAGRLAKRAG